MSLATYTRAEPTTPASYFSEYDPERPPWGLPWSVIMKIVNDRLASRSPLFSSMIDVRDRYNGTWVQPIPDVEGEPLLPPLTPAIIANGTDNLAVNASSVLESIWCPALNPHEQTGRRSTGYARVRRQALAATWWKNNFNLTRRRAYRHLAAYATCAIVVTPDFSAGIPRIEVRDPLSAACPRRRPSRRCGPPTTAGSRSAAPGRTCAATSPSSRRSGAGRSHQWTPGSRG